MTIRVSLDAEKFTKLVSGEIIKEQGPRGLGAGVFVEIALQDIGWHRMLAIIQEAMTGHVATLTLMPHLSEIRKAREDERKRCADKLREVAKSCGEGGHQAREKMFNAIATEIEAEPWKET